MNNSPITLIVLISIDFHNSRKVCEHIENTEYENKKQLSNDLQKKLDVQDFGDSALVYELTVFMDEVNNQTLDNLSEYFISYVQVKEL